MKKRNKDWFEQHCSFELATLLQINIKYFDFIDSIYGYYTPMSKAHVIVINSNLSLERQEKVCDHLMARHLLHEGIEFCLDHDTYMELERQNHLQSSLLQKKLTSLAAMF